MSDATKKAKKDRKAKARREKAKGIRARQAEASRAADAAKDPDQPAPQNERQSFRSDGKRLNAKTVMSASSPSRKTQGK